MTTAISAFVAQREEDRQLRVVTPREPVLAKLGRLAAKAVARWERARTLVMATGGFGFLSAAAWTYGAAAGLAATGLSLLVLEYLSGGQK